MFYCEIWYNKDIEITFFMDVLVQIFTVRKRELDDSTYPYPYTEHVRSSMILDERIVQKMLKEIELPNNLKRFKYENDTFVKERNMYWLQYEDLCSVIEWLQRLYDNTYGRYSEKDWSLSSIEKTYYECRDTIRAYIGLSGFNDVTGMENTLFESIRTERGDGQLNHLVSQMECEWNMYDSYVFMRIG